MEVIPKRATIKRTSDGCGSRVVLTEVRNSPLVKEVLEGRAQLVCTPCGFDEAFGELDTIPSRGEIQIVCGTCGRTYEREYAVTKTGNNFKIEYLTQVRLVENQ